MPTASIVPGYKTALQDAWDAAVPAYPMGRRWPGGTTQSESVWLGESRSEQDIATIKQGRQWRDEEAELEVIFTTYRSSVTPTDSDLCDVWMFEQYEALDDLLAADPTLGGATGLSGWSAVAGHVTEAGPFQTGWLARLTATVRINARLT